MNAALTCDSFHRTSYENTDPTTTNSEPYCCIINTSLSGASGRCSASAASGRIQGDLASGADRFLALDLNGDKKTDFLYYRPGGKYVEGYISHGDGTFRYVPYTIPGQQFNGFTGDAADSRDTAIALDFNGDGKQDFLWYRLGGGWALLYISKGDGQFYPGWALQRFIAIMPSLFNYLHDGS